MTAQTIRETFPKKLLHYMAENQKCRYDLVNDLGFKYSTIRDWEKGLTVPRMDKVELLAQYFNCTTADLLEDREVKPTAKEEDGLTDLQREIMTMVQGAPEDLQKEFRNYLRFSISQRDK